LGQTNHYLITLLVGLDYIQKNDVRLPDEFKTSWNPRDKKASSIRSREFSINATLSWAIDALDAYLSLCHKRPTLYQNRIIHEAAGAAGQSVYAKFIVLRDYVPNDKDDIFKKVSALTEVAIQWRNKLVHYFADNEIIDETRKVLIDNSEYFGENFQGLSIRELLNRFDGNQPPRFKEITSIIRAIHKFVELADGYLLNTIDKEIHFVDCLDYHFKFNTKTENELKSKTALTYNLSPERRLRSLNQSIMNYGFNLIDKEQTKIKEEWINNLSVLSINEVMTFLKEPDFEKKKLTISKPTKKNN